MAQIIIKNLSKFFEKDTKVLDNVNLTINDGEFVIIIGKSGSGKTTLLNMISGIEKTLIGNISIDGEIISDMNYEEAALFRRKKIGIVYQDFNLLPMLNVENNILLPLYLNKDKKDDNIFKSIVSFLEIDKILFKYPSVISGGEKQRVALARAIINKPSLLLADEPTGNLDSNSSLKVLKLLKEVNEVYKTTIILVTHNEEYLKYATRVIKIEDGKIVQRVGDFQ